jgi:hypothetical protein
MSLTRRHKQYGAATTAAIVGLGLWLFLTRWTSDEAANAQHFQQAMLEVREAIAYANERGGMIDPSDADYLIDRYKFAAEQAELVSDDVLKKLHPRLTKAWRDIFVPSTKLYLRALKDQNRDLARQASLLQDDWVRWLRFNGQNVDVPPPPNLQSTQ